MEEKEPLELFWEHDSLILHPVVMNIKIGLRFLRGLENAYHFQGLLLLVNYHSLS